jgi:FdhE protein
VALTSAARLLTPEEIAVQAGQQVAYLRLPDRVSVFADRELRLRELAAGHAMRDYLIFIAELTRSQHEVLQDFAVVEVPDAAALDAAAQAGLPPLPPSHWPRDPVWRSAFHRLLDHLLPRLIGSSAQAVVQALRGLDDTRLEQQADRLLGGEMLGLDLAAAPLIAAGLQTYWTHLVLATNQSTLTGRQSAFGRTDDATLCPCCGSRPTASISRIGAEASGFRYLHCSLCSAQWHMVRIKCSNCESTKGIQYQSLQAIALADSAAGNAKPAIQAETCDECGHYLKLVHMERDAAVDPVADDLATVTLDLLVADAGFQRHGVNLLLLFGDPEAA